MAQIGAELDLTKYDVERADDYQEFKDRIMDAESIEMGEERIVIQEIKKALTKELSVLSLSEEIVDAVNRLLDGTSMKGIKMPVREEASVWLKDYLKRK